jgi:hypothetical protein
MSSEERRRNVRATREKADKKTATSSATTRRKSSINSSRSRTLTCTGMCTERDEGQRSRMCRYRHNSTLDR